MKSVLSMRLAAALTIAAGTSSSRTTESTGEYADDAAITSKVKAAPMAGSICRGVKGVHRPQASADAAETWRHLT